LFVYNERRSTTRIIVMDLRLARSHQARLDVVEGIKCFVAERLVAELRRDYEAWMKNAKPAEADLRRREFMAARFARDPLYQASRGLQRVSQEAMWRCVQDGYEARRATIEATLDGDTLGGTLALDPHLAMPAYFDRTDFHLQPGSYHKDTLAGPVYETGVAAYTMHRYGRAGDEMGQALLSVLPQRRWRRIVELGCGPGYKAYPLVDAFAEAEFHAIDLSAPMLKYAHHRARAHGKPIAFAQMNAERTRYPAGHFDLVYCMLLLHEMPMDAIANVELPSYDALDPLSAYLMDWDTQHNGEPYWRAYHELDLESLYRDSGFMHVRRDEAHSAWGSGSYMGNFTYHVTMGTRP
jgi:SAM-dependent methyltransferase